MNRFYGQFDPPVDQFIFERYFPDKDIKGTFVECGAFDGLTECSCKYFEETMGWKGYNFEPVPWIFEKLSKNRPNSRNLNFALSDTIGVSQFQAIDHPEYGLDCTNGSLAHMPQHAKWLDDIGCKYVSVAVKLRTWLDFVEQEAVRHVDLLVLDVEGHELAVIEGMAGSAVLPDIICIEIGHLAFGDVRASLGALGYIYDISSHVNAFFVKGELLPLFALRRAAGDKLGNGNALVVAQAVASHQAEVQLEAENGRLREHVRGLEEQIAEIGRSRAWRLITALRRILRGK
jgi:FkbM family methyltransferase